MEIKCDTSNVGEVLKSMLKDVTPITIKIENGKPFSITVHNETEPKKEQEPIVIGGCDDEVKVSIGRHGDLYKVGEYRGEQVLYAQRCFRLANAECTSNCIDFRISDDNSTLHTCKGSYNIKLVPIVYQED